MQWKQKLLVFGALIICFISYKYVMLTFVPYPKVRLSKVINNFNFSFPITPQQGCPPSLNLTIIVQTQPQNVETRDKIRTTWGNAVKENRWPSSAFSASTRVFFLMTSNNASEVSQEAKKEDDLIVASNRGKMSENIVLALTWIRKHCSGTRYTVIMDDNFFVKVPVVWEDILYQCQSRICGLGKHAYFERNLVLSENFFVIPNVLFEKVINISRFVPSQEKQFVYVNNIASSSDTIIVANVANYKLFDSETVACDFLKYEGIAWKGMSPMKLEGLWQVLQTPDICKNAD